MRVFVSIVGMMLLFAAGPQQASADGPTRQELMSLDDQVQEIKTEVLGVAAELSVLEEQLLYPSGTHVAVFVSLSKEDPYRLDAIQIRMDGDLAAHHIYSFKELDALQSGGVQRLFTGNVSSGEHEIEISVIGKLEGGKEYAQTEKFTFNKDVKPRLLGIALASPGSGRGAIELETW